MRQTEGGFDVERQRGEDRKELIGYVLPLTPDDLQHLTVFVNGKMCVSEPNTRGMHDAPQTREIIESKYRETFANNSVPIKYLGQSVDEVINNFGKKSDRIITGTNDSAQSTEQFATFIDQAVTVASERKAEREQVQRSTMNSFVDKFGAFFRRGEQDTPAPSQETSGEQPPSQEPSPEGNL